MAAWGWNIGSFKYDESLHHQQVQISSETNSHAYIFSMTTVFGMQFWTWVFECTLICMIMQNYSRMSTLYITCSWYINNNTYKEKSVFLDSITFHMISQFHMTLHKIQFTELFFLICRIFTGKYLTIWEFLHYLHNIQHIRYLFPGLHWKWKNFSANEFLKWQFKNQKSSKKVLESTMVNFHRYAC